MSKRLFFDLETTGVVWSRNAIHQLAALIEIDGEVVEKINWNMAPFEGAKIEEAALKVGGVTLKQVEAYPDQLEQFKAFKLTLTKYVDKFDKKDKFHLVGYNNCYFDDRFLRAWFERNGDEYFGSWFWADSLDVMVLASQHLYYQRPKMINFKLGTVAQTLGIQVLESKLHDGLYDVELTRAVYNKITNADLLG